MTHKYLDKKYLKLHLGSGADYWNGYVNIDLDPAAKADLHMNVLDLGREFSPDSVSEVVALHALNYLSLWEARVFLKLIYQLLQNEGRLIIETVNLEKALEKIRENNENLDEYIEGVRALHGFGLDHMQAKAFFTANKFSWTPWHLKRELEQAGFTNVQISSPQSHVSWRDMRIEAIKETHEKRAGSGSLVSHGAPAPVSKRIMIVLYPPLGTVTVHIRGLIFKDSFIENGWVPEYLDIRTVGEEKLVEMAANFDVVYLLKIPSFSLVQKLRQKTAAKIVFDLTDALWMPHHRPAGWSDLELILSNVDAVFSDNEFVADFGRKYNKSVFVIPACTQVEKFDKARETAAKSDNGKIIIGWVGTASTLSALANIQPALESVFKRHPDLELRILAAGCTGPEQLPAFEFVRYSLVTQYSEDDMIREVLQMDIGLFPPPVDVEDFAIRGPLKGLIYMTGGIPAVCQNAGDCARLIEDGVSGMLPTTLDEWESKLEMLINSPELRMQMGKRGLEKVRDRNSLSAVYRTLENALYSVMLAGSHHPVKVLIFYDEEGWAWWHRAHHIKNNVSEAIQVDIRKTGTAFDHNDYDLILLFEYYLFDQVRHVPREKIIVGSSCPKTLEPTAQLIQHEHCLAGLVNNLDAHAKIAYLGNVYCCQNGVDTTLFFPSNAPPPSELTACWVGNANSMGNKGLDLMEEACRLAGIRFFALDLSSKIGKEKLFTQEELREHLYRNASFYLCASEYEGTPNPALEALACGLPVVTTRVGNMPEIIVDGVNGFIVERSVEGILAGINRLKQANLEDLGKNARLSVENGWKWSDQVKKYENMFRALFLKSRQMHEMKQPASAALTSVGQPVQPLMPAVQEGSRHKPLVTVIVPTHNRPDMLTRALRSIMAQTYPNIEIVVVNDAGLDVSNIIGWLGKDANITYVRHGKNRGLAAARNTALNVAQGEIIAYLDDDDVFLPNHVETIVDALVNLRAQFVYTEAEHVTEMLDCGQYKEIGRLPSNDVRYSKEHLHVLNFIPVNTWGHWKSCVAQVGRFDEGLDNHEDWDFLLRCSRRFDLVHIPKHTVQVHQRAQGDNMLRRERSKFYDTFKLIYSRYDDLGQPEVARGRSDTLKMFLNPEVPPAPDPASLEGERGRVRQQESVVSRSKPRFRCVIYSTDFPIAACALLRLIDPLSRLKSDIEFVWAVSLSNNDIDHPDRISSTVDLDILATADLVIIQRFFPLIGEFHHALKIILSAGKPVIYETDDSLTSMPDDNPHAKFAEKNRDALLDCVAKCCAVTVSTKELRNEYLKYNPSVYVLPNLLDEGRWFRKTLSDAIRSDRVVIGYAGTLTHAADLELIEDALERISQKYSDKVAFKFIGCATPRMMALPNAEMANFKVAYDEYPEALRQLGLDIAVAPLQDNAFNRCKSNIKWLEYSAVGIAGVYSDLPPYNECVEHMRTGMLANSDPESWMQALDYLVSNPDARHAMVKAAQDEIKAKYTLESGVRQYLDTYSEIIRNNPVKMPIDVEATNQEKQDVSAKAYQTWISKHSLQEIDAQLHAERLMLQWKAKPAFHFVMTLTGGDEPLLANTIDSLSAQMYGEWKLSIVAKFPSPDPIFEELAQLQWIEIQQEESYSEGMNRALNAIQSDWVALVEPGLMFEPQMMLVYGDYMNIRPHWHMVYCDEDVLGPDNTRSDPKFKPDFNLDLLRSMPYFGALCMVKRDALLKIGGYSDLRHAENYDLAFRILETYGESAIGHISEMLCHLPAERVNGFSESAGKLALGSHLARQNVSADIAEGYQHGTFRIDYRFETQPKVSVVIPTRDKLELLQPCIEGLLSKTNYPDFEVIVVDNQSEDPDIFDYYLNLADRFGDKVRVLHYDHDFNYAAISNMAVSEAHGEYILFLNNDTRVIQAEWLERMVAHGQRQEVGIVGSRLIFPDSNQIQHAGVLLGLNTIADHLFLGQLDMSDPGYMGRAHVDQDYSAVTAACMLIRKSVYQEVGGMDEKDLQVSYNDVDLCLKVREKGYKIVWTPYASLVHDSHSSLRDAKKDPEKFAQNLIKGKHERETMLLRWLPKLAEDPAYNRHLSLVASDCRVESDIVIDWDVNFHDRPRILGVPLPGGSGFYRIISPFQALSEAALAQTNVVQTSKMAITRVLNPVELERTHADTIVLHAPLDDNQIGALQDYKKYNSQMRIFMLDDLVTNPPLKSSFFKQSYRDAKPRLRKALSLSDRLIVTTQPLADACQSMIEDIRIVPNMLRRSQWAGVTSKRRQGKKPRVGWAGAQQHQGDLALIIDVVKATSVMVDWVFFGMCLDELRPYAKEVHEFQLAHQDYIEKLASLNLDLAVAPLEVHPFNEAKSNLRLLEYGYLGWPVVCTDIYPYQNAPVKRVPNETAAWIEAIHERVNDLDAAETEGDALRQWVQDNYLMEDHLTDWLAALTR